MSKREARLDRELQFHLDQHVADLVARGVGPVEARRLARIALGGPEQVKEYCRDQRPTRWLEDLLQDVRYALRTLRQRPGFAAVALVTLALGIGAATVMFTVVDGVLLKPLPYPQPDRLVRVHAYTSAWNVGLFGDQNLSYPDFLDCRRESKTLDIAGGVWNFGTLSEPGDAVHVDFAEITSNLFPLLGAHLFQGRNFLPEEDQPGGTPVAIISYGLWQRQFGANRAAIGTSLVLDAKRYTVVGVLPIDFHFMGGEPDVYALLSQDTQPYLHRRGPHPVGVDARLLPGATLAQAKAELATIGSRLAAQYPDTNKDRSFLAKPLQIDVSDVRSSLWLLLAAVGVVLLIACANIASLLLARAISRERELAMRVALGAGRGRLARQCLTESALLALLGGALGVALASLGIRPFVALWPGDLPRVNELHLDWRVLLFALAVSLASGLLFGIAPALRTRARDLEQSLRAGARNLTGGARRLHGVFVISEIALAVVLLVSAAMLGRTLLRLNSLDPGFNVHHVLTARVGLAPSTLEDPGRTRAAWNDLLNRVRAVPGVESAAAVDIVPMREGNNMIGYRTSAAEVPEEKQPMVLASSATPDYLKVAGIPLRAGRFLGDQDRIGAQSVAVIDDVMARQAFPGQDPIGRQLWIGIGADPVTVVGVVGHVRYWGLAGDDQNKVRAQLYYPLMQVPDNLMRRWSELMSIGVRTSVEPLTLLEPLRRVVRGAGNDQVLYEPRTLERLAADSLARQRFLLLLFGVFAGLALLLACIGIHGVLAYLTTLRIPEIGVRMALGATGGEVMFLVLRQSLAMILAGVGVGVAGALGAGRVLMRLVDGMQGMDPSTVVIPAICLTAAALFASFLPARRASHVDPMKALRQD
jgi:predicted permease